VSAEAQQSVIAEKQSAFDPVRLVPLRHYDTHIPVTEGISWRHHALLWLAAGLLVVFIVWANLAVVEEISRGTGQVVPSADVQVLQSLEGGIVESFPVRTGDVVQAGDVVLRLRGVQAEADLKAAEKKYLGLRATMARLQAEATGSEPVFDTEILSGAMESVQAEKDAFVAGRTQMQAQADILEQQKLQRQQSVTEIRRRIQDVTRELSLLKEERGIVAPLVEAEVVSRRQLLQLDRQIAERQTELNTQELSLPRTESAAAEAIARMSEAEDSYRVTAQRALAEKTAEMHALQESIAAYRDRSARREMRAPLEGIVKDIKIKTVGGVVSPGAPVMEIVPLDGRLMVEAHIRPADIAFIHEGQRAVVRISAYDFSIYGAMEGVVSQVSADALVNERGESYYRVRVETQASDVVKNGRHYPVIPGMQATVDIVTGDKSVMQYLLKPFIKASQTALRER